MPQAGRQAGNRGWQVAVVVEGQHLVGSVALLVEAPQVQARARTSILSAE